MTPNPADFNSGAIAPVECIKEGWALIKDQYWLFFGITFVGMLVGSAFAIVLLGPMTCGIFICMFQQQRRQPLEFGMVFKGFDYFLPAFLVQLLKSIPIIVFVVPFYIAMVAVTFGSMPEHGRPSDTFPLAIFGTEIVFFSIMGFVHMLVEIVALFALPLVVDRKLAAMDALKLSFRAAKANLGGVIGFILLDAVLRVAGLMLCIVGFYFYLPISFAAYAVAYRRVFSDIGELGQYPPPPPPQSWAA
jgi:hypothetical protein